jgi:hypothetical protein
MAADALSQGHSSNPSIRLALMSHSSAFADRRHAVFAKACELGLEEIVFKRVGSRYLERTCKQRWKPAFARSELVAE